MMSKAKKAIYGLLFLLVSLGVLPWTEGLMQVGMVLGAEGGDFLKLESTVNMTSVREHVEYLSRIMYETYDVLPTRATGSRGNDLAAEYIRKKFLEYGLQNVSYFNFDVTIPLSRGANITFSEGNIMDVYPVLPNLVCPSTTPPEGVTGDLVYAGSGYLEDFDGKKVEGSIVIMDWDTESRWLNAVKLGAKALVFLPPEDPLLSFSSYGKRESKSEAGKYLEDTPLTFPRFYVKPEDSLLLLAHIGETATVRSSVVWTTVTGRDVLGFIPGDNPDVTFAISSYYDSYSLAPDIAPGAQDACGVAALLDLAKYFSQNKPKMSLYFVAFGGHYQSLAGSYAWAEDLSTMNKIWMIFNLDVSTGTNGSYVMTRTSPLYGVTWQGSGFTSGSYPVVTVPSEKMFAYLRDLKGRINQARQDAGLGPHEVYMSNDNADPIPDVDEFDQALPNMEYLHDDTAFNNVNQRPLCVTFHTAKDIRPYVYTPFDTFSGVKLDNLQTQLEYAYAIILHVYLNEETSHLTQEIIESYDPSVRGLETDAARPVRRGDYRGQASVWSAETNWYKPVPNALVSMRVYDPRSKGAKPEYWGYTASQDFVTRFTFAEENGTFRFKHFAHSSNEVNRMNPYFEAWIIDPSTGELVAGPDLGTHQFHPYPLNAEDVKEWTGRDADLAYVAMSNFSSIVLFDNWLAGSYVSRGDNFLQPEVIVNDFSSHTELEDYSAIYDPLMGITTVLMPPGKTVEIIIQEEYSRYPNAFLVNATLEQPSGSGYTFSGQTVFTFPYLRYAENFQRVISGRWQILGRFKPTREDVRVRFEHAEHLVEEAHRMLQAPIHNYSVAYNLALEAWDELRWVYENQRGEIEASVAVAPYLALLLVPFTFLAERLLFKTSGNKRIIGTLGIFAVVMAAFWFVHPAFQVSASPVMTIIGFSTAILLAPVILIMFSRVSDIIASTRIRRRGQHEIGVSRTDQGLSSFFVGIENMRRRKFRTALTLVSIALMVCCMSAFTSIVPQTVHGVSLLESGQPAYPGILIHYGAWGSHRRGFWIGETATNYVTTMFSDRFVTATRSWYQAWWCQGGRFGASNYTNSGLRVTYGGKSLDVHSLLGLTPEEIEVLDLFSLLKGRWFVPGEKYACVLTMNQANMLGINETDLPVGVKLQELPFTVIGIVDDDLLRMTDLDGEAITPIYLRYSQTPEGWETHTPPLDNLVVPYWTVVNLYGGNTASIGLKAKDATHTDDLVLNAAFEISDVLESLSLYVCPNVGRGLVFNVSPRITSQVMGLEFQVPLLSIALLSVLNIMLGGVHERRGDIRTYSSLGLSPLNIFFMFIGETAVYSVLASVAGFIGGMLLLKVVAPMLVMPVMYTATAFTFAAGFSMVAVLLSSIYPSLAASRMVTPSLERAWKLPTNPVGDKWEIPLPFFSTRVDEVNGIVSYISEFFENHAIPDAPTFWITRLKYDEGTVGGYFYKGLSATQKLAPYESAVTQESRFLAIRKAPSRWQFTVLCERKAGKPEEWALGVRRYMDDVRKQMLLWRFFKPPQQKAYSQRFRTMKKDKQ